MSSNADVAFQQQEILSTIIKFALCETSLVMIAPSWTQATTAIKFEIIASFLSETFSTACLDLECYVSEINLERRLQRLITEHVGSTCWMRRVHFGTKHSCI